MNTFIHVFIRPWQGLSLFYSILSRGKKFPLSAAIRGARVIPVNLDIRVR